MKVIDLSQNDWRKELENAQGDIKLKGVVRLDHISAICSATGKNVEYTLDLTEAENYVDEENWAQYLGWSHSGPVYGNSGTREVETYLRLLDNIWSKKVILPAFCMRRHINRLKANEDVKVIEVAPDSKLFSMKDGDVWNKKGTKIVFVNEK